MLCLMVPSGAGLTLFMVPKDHWSRAVSHSNISGNNFANELAGNGGYNLFAAFINSELSFTQFYRTAPNEQVLNRLRTLVAEKNNS